MTETCTVSIASGAETMTITAEANGKTDVLTFSVTGGSLKLPDEFSAVNVIIVAASYNSDGQMTGIQFLKEGEDLTVSGSVKVFFLDANYMAILPNING